MTYDLLLRAGTLVDPAHGVEGARDLGIESGRVVTVAKHIDDAEAGRVVDASGRTILPGIIDSHCHVGGTSSRSRHVGHRMVAETGVTTVLDMGSTMETLIGGMRDHGAGDPRRILLRQRDARRPGRADLRGDHPPSARRGVRDRLLIRPERAAREDGPARRGSGCLAPARQPRRIDAI